MAKNSAAAIREVRIIYDPPQAVSTVFFDSNRATVACQRKCPETDKRRGVRGVASPVIIDRNGTKVERMERKSRHLSGSD